jgi:hypothetical protein
VMGRLMATAIGPVSVFGEEIGSEKCPPRITFGKVL